MFSGMGGDPAVPVRFVALVRQFPQLPYDGFEDGRQPVQVLGQFGSWLDVRAGAEQLQRGGRKLADRR
jgi:hypothetical protein